MEILNVFLMCYFLFKVSSDAHILSAIHTIHASLLFGGITVSGNI